MENNWEIKTLRVKVKKYDDDPKWYKSGNEDYVPKMIEYSKNTNDYIYNILKSWRADLWM